MSINTARMDAAIFGKIGDAAQLKDPFGGFKHSLQGIFEYEYVEIGGNEARSPVFTCATVDLPADSHRFILDIPNHSKDYKIVTPQPDGTGVTKILLERIA